MKNEISIKSVKNIIDSIFSNTSVSRKETLDDIQEIVDYCESYIFNLELDESTDHESK